ncbi:lipopolysaccharide heptosyltransferase II, partial [bacterium]|nr:lipopolysaccharide heptosyltransferase II [bacterium]
MKILVRSPNWIGDAVLCLSSIEYIKGKMPQAHITVLAKDWVKEIFLNHPSVDKVISLNKSKISLIKDLRQTKFDIGILFTNSFSSAFLFFLAGIKKRIGYKTDLRSLFLTDSIPLPKNLNTLHQRDYYFKLVKKLIPGNENPKNPVLYMSTEEIEKADTILEDFELPITNYQLPIIGIFPGASYGPAKMWDTRNFQLLADKIIKTDKAKVLIFGGNKEKELGEIIQNERNNIINLCGKTTLRETMALIKRCAVFITNDTGPMHIASALNITV